MKNLRLLGAILGGVVGLVATGCAKEQRAAPEQVAPAVLSPSAGDSAPPLSAAAAAAERIVSPSSQWIARVRARVPTEMCKEGSYFRECFKANGEECQALMIKHVGECLTRPGAIPAEINEENGRRSGRIVGECLGNAYEVELTNAGKALKTARCADISNWVPAH